MTEEALGAAVTRLERAIVRLERTAAHPAAPAPEGSGLVELEARHRRLRARVEEAVARLDGLLGEDG